VDCGWTVERVDNVIQVAYCQSERLALSSGPHHFICPQFVVSPPQSTPLSATHLCSCRPLSNVNHAPLVVHPTPRPLASPPPAQAPSATRLTVPTSRFRSINVRTIHLDGLCLLTDTAFWHPPGQIFDPVDGSCQPCHSCLSWTSQFKNIVLSLLSRGCSRKLQRE